MTPPTANEPLSVATPATTSLEAEEINVQTPLDPWSARRLLTSDPGTSLRHRGWAHNRSLIFAAFLRNGLPDSRLEAFRDCGSHAWLVKDPNDPDRLAIASRRCHDRYCRPCANERARSLAAAVQRAVGDKNHRFVTLTVRSCDAPLRVQVDRLYAAFRRLRRSTWWAHRVRGGAAFLELTWNRNRHQWHPHLHCLVDSKWLEQTELSAVWFRASRGSFVTHVTLVRQTADAVRYVTKYASKPIPSYIHNQPHLLDAAMDALNHRHLCLTFGSWRSIPLHDKSDRTPWEAVCSVATLVEAHRDGLAWATYLWPKIMELYRCTPRTCNKHPPRLDVAPGLFP